MKREDSDGQGFQSAAGAERPDLSGDAAVLAEDRSTVDPAPGQWHLAAAGDRGGELAFTTAAIAGR